MDIDFPKSPTDLPDLKGELQAALAGRLEGLEIDTTNHWALAPFQNPAAFFENLRSILPDGAILYAEGTSICDNAIALYAAHRAKNAVMVARDTIFPVPKSFHFNCSPELCEAMAKLFLQHESHEIFNHLKGYIGDRLLFTLHDGFGNVLRISQMVPEEKVAGLAQQLGVERKLISTKPRDLKQIEAFLAMLDNPAMTRKVFAHIESEPGVTKTFHSKPWWLRMWHKLNR